MQRVNIGKLSLKESLGGQIHLSPFDLHVTLLEEYRYDSLLAVSGSEKDGFTIRAARNQLLRLGLVQDAGDLRWRGEIQTGKVVSGETETNS